ncbi:sugar phosphate nucleotidyltransferase [Chloroflexota bacterium]
MLKEIVNKGVILAAGDGTRLGSLTDNCPKVLLPVNAQTPLISYPIEAMASAGITDIAVVVGHLRNKIIEALGDGSQFGVNLHYILNTDYLGGNAISVHKTKAWTQGEPVVLCMGDHLIEEKLVGRLMDLETVHETLCVDYTPAPHHQIDEATKVNINETDCIGNIGKELINWDALDTGVFLLTNNFYQTLDKLVDEFGINVEISDVIRSLINQGNSFNTCDTSGCFWMDVDTEEDLKVARM